MYTPKAFEMSEEEQIREFLHAHSFGVLMSTDAGVPIATHLPMVYDAGRQALFAHMAKANPQWQALDGQTVLAVFTGPHAYISPTWYQVPESVPTWNYVAVHVWGTCSLVTQEDDLAALLEQTVRFYEPGSDLPAQSGAPFYQKMMKAIVGFRVDITRIEGTAKLSQNKPPEVRRRIVDNLRKSEAAGADEVARWMERS